MGPNANTISDQRYPMLRPRFFEASFQTQIIAIIETTHNITNVKIYNSITSPFF